MEVAVEVVALMASSGHRYDGRPRGPVPEQEADRRTELEVRRASPGTGRRAVVLLDGLAALRDE